MSELRSEYADPYRSARLRANSVVTIGPGTRRPRRFCDGIAVVAPGFLFIADNILEGDGEVIRTTESAQAAYEHVLEDAGAALPRRDAVDKFIQWVKEAGGWP